MKVSKNVAQPILIFLSVTCQIAIILLGTVHGMPQQADPCENNPCGKNNLCTSNGGAVSCECAPGFSNDDPNDPWACVRSGSNSGVIVRGSSDDSLIDIPSRTAQDDFVRSPNRDKDARPTTTDRPSFLPPKETVIGFDESGREVMFTAAIAPGKDDKKSPPPVAGIPDNVLNRVPFQTKNPTINRAPIDGSHRLDGLDIDVIYNAECLSSADCANNEYCNIGVNLCQDACTLNVCGEGSLCKGKLHRPLCYCPKGFEGNPHEVCTKTKSRAGQKFRKRRHI